MAAYRIALISFIDILGFRQLVATRSASEIAAILRKMRNVSTGDDSGEDFAPKLIQFSDSIIRVRPLDSKANEESPYGVLFHELVDIGMMQGELADKNVYIRGGMTLGQISYEENTIFGPGFIRAYDLETKIANYPRIVIDRTILDAMKTDNRLFSAHNSRREELGYIARQMRRGSDGIHFVDYLRTTLNNLDDPDVAPDFLIRNKAHILANIKSVSELDGESAKYLWAALYHNQFIGELDLAKNKRNAALRITDDELPLLETVEDRSVHAKARKGRALKS